MTVVLALGSARRRRLAEESLTGNLFSFQLLFCLVSAGASLATACDSPDGRRGALPAPGPLPGPEPGLVRAEPQAPLDVPARQRTDRRALAKLLGVDAGELESPVDPPAPAGDLKADIDRFTTIDECALDRARLDPLVGDALEAVGYDTFLRDACRVIDAAKANDPERCAAIDASSLEARCRATVAEVAGTPDACPWDSVRRPDRGRDPRCLAIASRDLRLCVAVTDPLERATCEATLSRDDRPCSALAAGAARSRCARDADRWHGVLASANGEGRAAPSHDAPLAAAGTLHVARVGLVAGAGRGAGPQTLDVDLAPDFAQGITLLQQRDGVRFALGPLTEAGLGFVAPSPHVRPSLALELFVTAGPHGAGPVARIERVELVVPGQVPVATPAAESTLTAKLDRLDSARASPVAVVVDGEIGAAGTSWRVHAEATTFVRDVVRAADAYRGPARTGLDGGMP
jgi:hypothetical protein